jgi:hypothetical protein
VSGANDSATVSDEEQTQAQDHEPHIQVVKGRPTDDEMAAVITVLAALSRTPPEPREQEDNLWGHPVDRLRYPTFSWQRVTLVERTHMRK